MKCHECGGDLEVTRKDYLYLESGLPNVTVCGIEVRRCKQCSNEDIVIPRLKQLHRAIAKALLEKSSRFVPAEIRFLRKHLGWSQEDFARVFGLRPETISRWETGSERMSAPADRLLRLVVAKGDRVASYSVAQLQHLDDDNSEDLGLALKSCGSSWEPELKATTVLASLVKEDHPPYGVRPAKKRLE